jgi:hypothetical protein
MQYPTRVINLVLACFFVVKYTLDNAINESGTIDGHSYLNKTH